MAETVIVEVIKGLGRGGAETLLLERLRRSTAGRYRYIVINTRPVSRALGQEFLDAGIDLRDAGPSPISLLRALKAARPSLVNVHSPVPGIQLKFALQGVWGASRRPILVETVHNTTYANRATRYAATITGGMPTATVCVSSSVASGQLTTRSTAVEVIRHGVDGSRIRAWQRAETEAHRSSLRVSDSQVVIAMVANFRPQKNHMRLVKAVESLASKGLRPRELIILCAGGGATLAPTVAAVRDRGITEFFRFLGPVHDGWKTIAVSDGALLTSDHEGLPVSVMEALAAGVPFLSTDVGGVGELIRHRANGLLFPPESSAVASAIESFATSEDLRSSLRAGAQMSSAEVDIDRTVLAIEDLYAKLLSQ